MRLSEGAVDINKVSDMVYCDGFATDVARIQQ
jgi:hypothetical protein